jgi:hypothetical protein
MFRQIEEILKDYDMNGFKTDYRAAEFMYAIKRFCEIDDKIGKFKPIEKTFVRLSMMVTMEGNTIVRKIFERIDVKDSSDKFLNFPDKFLSSEDWIEYFQISGQYKTPSWFGRDLRSQIPNLRTQGIIVEMDSRRRYKIRRMTKLEETQLDPELLLDELSFVTEEENEEKLEKIKELLPAVFNEMLRLLKDSEDYDKLEQSVTDLMFEFDVEDNDIRLD